MKPSLYLILIVLLCSLIGASFFFKSKKTVTTIAADGTITETPLPKGKFIIDDETAAATTVHDPNTYNGKNGQDTTSSTKVSKEDDEATRLKRKYKNLLVFHADDTMKVKKSYIAKLILSKDQALGTIKAEVLEGSSSKKDNIVEDTSYEIGSKMKAVLKSLNEDDGKGFEIEELGNATQSINDKRKKAMWSWKITPFTEGEQHLVLTVNIIEKEDEQVNLPPKDIKVTIFAKSESTMSKVTAFIEKNYQWMLGTLLIPLFLGWFNARMRHRFDRKIFAERDKTNAAGFNQHPAAPLQHTVQNTEPPKEIPPSNNSNNNATG